MPGGFSTPRQESDVWRQRFAAPGQDLPTTVEVIDGATSLEVICWDIPKGGGVANFNWNPYPKGRANQRHPYA